MPLQNEQQFVLAEGPVLVDEADAAVELRLVAGAGSVCVVTKAICTLMPSRRARRRALRAAWIALRRNRIFVRRSVVSGHVRDIGPKW